MISIAIPVFNRDVRVLIAELSDQISSSEFKAEIIVIDDASTANYQLLNRAIAILPHVQYMQLEKNIGRINIRQLLAKKAKFQWILFLDCDGKIISPHFLYNYYNELKKETAFDTVIVGGRHYQENLPTECRLRLHWKYGTKRERIGVIKKDKDPYTGFMSNNFLVPVKIFQKLVFEKGWKEYGHEDTWIGIQLEYLKVPVMHINNIIIHDGLEDRDVFIRKSESAVQNLVHLSNMVNCHTLKRHVKLYRYYCRLKSLRITSIVDWLISVLLSKIENNLSSCNPSLLFFDLYRLHNLIYLMQGK